MSHTTTINSVEIKDVAALGAAINELKSKGINCEMLENARPRAYYGNQEGLNKNADYVLKLNDSKYDVGFYKNDQGSYDARCDLWADQVAKQIGVPVTEGVSREQAAIGKLLNLYSVHAVARQAARQGYRVQRVDQDNGAVQLRVAV